MRHFTPEASTARDQGPEGKTIKPIASSLYLSPPRSAAHRLLISTTAGYLVDLV